MWVRWLSYHLARRLSAYVLSVEEDCEVTYDHGVQAGTAEARANLLGGLEERLEVRLHLERAVRFGRAIVETLKRGGRGGRDRGYESQEGRWTHVGARRGIVCRERASNEGEFKNTSVVMRCRSALEDGMQL